MFTRLRFVNGPLVLLEFASAPQFELISNLFSVMCRCCDHGVTMIGAAVHGMQMPSPQFAMLLNRLVDDRTFRFVEHDRFVDHPPTRPIGQQRPWNAFAFVPLRPAPLISR